jgi:hypothetical protein
MFFFFFSISKLKEYSLPEGGDLPVINGHKVAHKILKRKTRKATRMDKDIRKFKFTTEFLHKNEMMPEQMCYRNMNLAAHHDTLFCTLPPLQPRGGAWFPPTILQIGKEKTVDAFHGDVQ